MEIRSIHIEIRVLTAEVVCRVMNMEQIKMSMCMDQYKPLLRRITA